MIDRRNFLQMAVGGAAAAHARPISAATSRGVLGANDRVRVGLIGCGSRGNQVSRDWMKHPDSVFVAACDAYKERLDQTVERIAGVQGTSPEAYEDYRRILDRKDVDAVFIATPDHWHSPMTVDACAAGKDVYVEKPVSHNVSEGRRIVEAARKYDRICQTGTQSRSNSGMREAIAFLHSGKLGKVSLSRGLCYKRRQSIGLVYGDQRVPALLQAVTRDEVHAVARQAIDPSRAAIVVAGPYDGALN